MFAQVELSSYEVANVAWPVVVSGSDLRAVEKSSIDRHGGTSVYMNSTMMNRRYESLNISPADICMCRVPISDGPRIVLNYVLGSMQNRIPTFLRVQRMATKKDYRFSSKSPVFYSLIKLRQPVGFMRHNAV
jgi:hypothetical protein